MIYFSRILVRLRYYIRLIKPSKFIYVSCNDWCSPRCCNCKYLTDLLVYNTGGWSIATAFKCSSSLFRDFQKNLTTVFIKLGFIYTKYQCKSNRKRFRLKINSLWAFLLIRYWAFNLLLVYLVSDYITDDINKRAYNKIDEFTYAKKNVYECLNIIR